jgi:SAM-dependent methyltransferase
MHIDKYNRYNQLALSTVYSEPEEGNFHSDLIPKMINNYIPLMDLDKKASIFDIGCGQGLFIQEMARHGYHDCLGVTLSKDDFTACLDKGLNVWYGDFSDLEFASDNKLDMIWCRHALEHSPNPLFTLYEFNRILKIGGKIYVEVPAPDCPRGHEYNSNHYSILGMNMWVSLFKKAGLAITLFNTYEFDLQIQEKPVQESYFIFILEKKVDLV